MRYVFTCASVNRRIADLTICVVPTSAIASVDDGAVVAVVAVEVAKVLAVVVGFVLPDF